MGGGVKEFKTTRGHYLAPGRNEFVVWKPTVVFSRLARPAGVRGSPDDRRFAPQRPVLRAFDKRFFQRLKSKKKRLFSLLFGQCFKVVILVAGVITFEDKIFRKISVKKLFQRVISFNCISCTCTLS